MNDREKLDHDEKTRNILVMIVMLNTLFLSASLLLALVLLSKDSLN